MTAYVSIPNADIDTDSPITQALMTALRDNPTAITEGSSGAPKILRPAFNPGVLLQWAFDYGTAADGNKTVVADENASHLSYNYDAYQISAGWTVTATDGIMIVRAQTSITINGTITAKGQGPAGGASRSGTNNNGFPGSDGYFGGSGGGGGAGNNTAGDGGDGGDTFQTAGGAGLQLANGLVGSAQSTAARRMFTDLQNLYQQENGIINSVGGAGGGGGGVGSVTSSGAGGGGGGVIILIAPLVSIGASGVIDCDGADGTSGATSTGGGGGGGGGTILIVTPTGGYTDASGGGVHAAGGAGASGTGGAYSGAAGGAGFVENFTL